MPVFSLGDELIFPHPVVCDPDGLLAIGGDLSPARLLLAYRWGIFPWYHEGQPLLWWWLAPRLMVRPENVHVSHSVRNCINKGTFKVTFNQAFKMVMSNCATVYRPGQSGTWIMPEMMDAYSELHQLGYAHSVEVYDAEGLAGGLYGILLGNIFVGESMFALRPNASKVGFITLAQRLAKEGLAWIDCQQDTPHMRSMGAELMDENDYLKVLQQNQLDILCGREKTRL